VDRSVSEDRTGATVGDDAVLAMAMPNYLVTPGDRYLLRFTRSFTPTTLTTIVDHDYTLNLNFLGTINAGGETFAELQDRVEALVEDSYPGSTPGLSIASLGRFQVYLSGEVEAARWITVTGLTRLDAITRHFTPFSSRRRIEVESTGGSRTYDLFAAARDGDSDQNPFLRPSDRVVVKPYDRQVRVTGQVKKPGTYQLTAGDELAELIYRYGGGPTVKGDLRNVRVTRYPRERGSVARVAYMDADELPEYPLMDQDVVLVPDRTSYLPVVFFEGAVAGDEQLSGDDASNRIRYQFRPGESLVGAVRSLAERFTSVSDLKNAYIVRIGTDGPISVDITELLTSPSREHEIFLQPLDRIVVPFRQFFVAVGGAVALPGRYPYIPDRTYEYYVGLAGGPDPNRNIGGRARIRSVDGERRSRSDYIEPEDSIYVVTNNPLAYVTPFATVVGAAVSILSLVLATTGN
jgi:protein involved in polysaccharide export with SLBB domain